MIPAHEPSNDASSKDHREWLLFQGIKGLLRCDESQTVDAIARYVMGQYRILGAASGSMERRRQTSIPARVTFLAAAVRFLEVREGRSRSGGVWVARLKNERRYLERLPLMMSDSEWTEWLFRRRPTSKGIFALLHQLLPNRRRMIRLARLLLRRQFRFYRVMRVIELIGYYTRYLNLFQRGRYSVALMSSHSNPHAIAFNIAARKCGVPVILITHGMPVRPVAKLACDLAVVHCEAARQIYVDAGWQMDRVFIHGQRQHYAHMPARLAASLSVGIFLCKDVNEDVLKKLTDDLLGDQRVSRIAIRPHTKNLWLGLHGWVASLNDHRLSLSQGTALQDDIANCDIVLGGNSSVLIEAVTAGRPSGYVEGLDHGTPDLHEFVARGLLYPLNDELELDPDEMLRFYQRPEWKAALRQFANIDEDDEIVMDQVVCAIRELIKTPA
jgi:hypothetical protein